MGCCSSQNLTDSNSEPLIKVFRDKVEISDFKKDNKDNNNNEINKDPHLELKPTINLKEGTKNENINVNELVNNMTFKNMKESKTIYIPPNLVDAASLAQNNAEIFEKIKELGNTINNDNNLLIKSTKTLNDYAYKKVDISDTDNEMTKKILKEVDILKKINHPNILTLYEAIISQDNKYIEILTEYVDDGDLQMKLDNNKKENSHFEEKQLLDWLSQLCVALKYIHSKNILHRNIKPSNIFLMKEGYVKLGDFGMAKIISNNGELKHAKTIMPKLEKNIPPEIIEKKDFTEKTDIWLLGVVFFELMTFKYPFKGENEKEIMDNILKENKNEYNYSYDQNFKDIIDKMLSKDPDKRPKPEEILENQFIRNRIESYVNENNEFFSKNTLKFFDDIDEIESNDENENNKKEESNKVKEIKIVEIERNQKKHKTVKLNEEAIKKYEKRKTLKAAYENYRHFNNMKTLIGK